MRIRAYKIEGVTMKIGEETYKDFLDLEHRMWKREDYTEEDINVVSRVVDYLQDNFQNFCEFWEKPENNGYMKGEA